jgi:purine-binding chemotaxis protein CheW
MNTAPDETERAGPEYGTGASYVTATIAGQLFGVPIGRVHDVFNIGSMTSVPLAPPDIVGLTSVRGRVVTAVDIRHRLGLAPAAVVPGTMAIGFEDGADAYGLVVDRIGEIVAVDHDHLQACPIHLGPSWAALSEGVCPTETGLMVLLDVDAMLGTPPDQPNTSRATESPQ